jgi:hypothetical protein
MLKHWQHVKNIMLGTCELNRDMFFTKQHVKVLFKELVQKIYQLHKNNAKNMCMWVQQNINLMFYYQEIGVEVDGDFIRQIMPFIKGIQNHGKRR